MTGCEEEGIKYKVYGMGRISNYGFLISNEGCEESVILNLIQDLVRKKRDSETSSE